MLRVGLTGGIGSGKSTVARRLVELGAVLVDADLLAREVVAKGSAGLDRIAEEFGPELIGPDGELDRPAMAAAVFADASARARLNAIVHPLVRARIAEEVAAAPAGAVVVQDTPLLIESGIGTGFALVVVVHADEQERVRRLVGSRGMARDDALARIRAQADDAARRAAADVWLDNAGTPGELAAAVDELWSARLVPFRDNVVRRVPAAGGPPRLVEPDPGWPAAAARLVARVAEAAGERGRGVEHVGPTAVPGLAAEDVIDLQLAVDSPADADALVDALAEVGFPVRAHGVEGDGSAELDPAHPAVRVHATADPGRPARLRVHVAGSPGWRDALLLRDWLRADAGARAEYAALAGGPAAELAGDADRARHAEAGRSWLDAARDRARIWADSADRCDSLD